VEQVDQHAGVELAGRTQDAPRPGRHGAGAINGTVFSEAIAAFAVRPR
jgi:hypothetical protein